MFLQRSHFFFVRFFINKFLQLSFGIYTILRTKYFDLYFTNLNKRKKCIKINSFLACLERTFKIKLVLHPLCTPMLTPSFVFFIYTLCPLYKLNCIDFQIKLFLNIFSRLSTKILFYVGLPGRM